MGRCGVLAGLVVVAVRLLHHAFNLLTIGALMRSLLALGNLARGSELIVMRASGMSVFRLARWVSVAGAILMVITWGLGDYIAPQAERFADRYKTLAKPNQYSTL